MSFRSEVIKIINEYLEQSKKITQLPAGDAPTGFEKIEAVQDGQNVYLTLSQIAAGTSITWGGFISAPPSLPLAADTQYVADSDFDFDGTTVFQGSVLFGPSGAADVSDFIIKP